MSESDEVTLWIEQLGMGDDAAATQLWENYFNKIVQYAKHKMGTSPRRAYDEEDVAISAMNSFCKGMQKGQFPKIDNRQDLWKLLVTITARKVYSQRRKAMADKRGGGQVRGESVFDRGMSDQGRGDGIGMVLGTEPTPEIAALVVENTNELLDCLGDEVLTQIALLKLEGHTNDEIALKLDCARRTVERKLERIREKWVDEGFTQPD